MNGVNASGLARNKPIDFLAELQELARDDPEDRLLLERWERLTLTVRCGLFANEPNRIRLFILSGQRLLQEGIGKPVPMYLRILQTLIKSAEDQALPVAWRHLCAEHFDLPLARLQSLLQRREPATLNAVVSRVDSVRAALLNQSGR
ncbi:MAG: hypothetical protein ACRBC3_01485 [Burkholderiaceae bacterium]